MKKAIAYIGCVASTWAGLWLALIADVTDDSLGQGGLSLIAAVLFCIAVLFAGYGNSQTWKKGKK